MATSDRSRELGNRIRRDPGRTRLVPACRRTGTEGTETETPEHGAESPVRAPEGCTEPGEVQVTAVCVGAFVRTRGGVRGRIVDRRTQPTGVWWLVKLYTDKDSLLWYKAEQLTVVDQ